MVNMANFVFIYILPEFKQDKQYSVSKNCWTVHSQFMNCTICELYLKNQSRGQRAFPLYIRKDQNYLRNNMLKYYHPVIKPILLRRLIFPQKLIFTLHQKCKKPTLNPSDVRHRSEHLTSMKSLNHLKSSVTEVLWCPLLLWRTVKSAKGN